jgi:hypothetical protein
MGRWAGLWCAVGVETSWGRVQVASAGFICSTRQCQEYRLATDPATRASSLLAQHHAMKRAKESHKGAWHGVIIIKQGGGLGRHD